MLRLDALATDCLAADIGGVSSSDGGLEVVIVLIGIFIASLSAGSLGRGAGRGRSNGVEAMRAGDGSVWYAVDRRRRVSATAAAAPTRSKAIGRKLATAEVVDGWG